MKINIFNETNNDLNYLNEKLINKARKPLVKLTNRYQVRRNSEINIIIIDDISMRGMNKEHRDIDKTTDVLSFPNHFENNIGDIFISYQKLEKQADEIGNTNEKEFCFLSIHGMLHVLGYDHEISSEEEKIMFDIQKQIINSIYK